MNEITRVDLAKRVYQVHAVNRSGHKVLARSMSPARLLEWAATLPANCLVAMESCSGAHHLARRLRLMGLDARLIAGQFVSPYRMQGANTRLSSLPVTLPQPPWQAKAFPSPPPAQ